MIYLQSSLLKAKHFLWTERPIKTSLLMLFNLIFLKADFPEFAMHSFRHHIFPIIPESVESAHSVNPIKDKQFCWTSAISLFRFIVSWVKRTFFRPNINRSAECYSVSQCDLLWCFGIMSKNWVRPCRSFKRPSNRTYTSRLWNNPQLVKWITLLVSVNEFWIRLLDSSCE